MADHNDAFLKLAAAARANIKEVSPEEAGKLVKDGALLIDVRDKEEFAKSHLKNAQHLSRGTLEMKIGNLAPDTGAAIVLYCAGGNRGALAAESLQRMGYSNVYSIEGGLSAYIAQAKTQIEASKKSKGETKH